MNSIKDIYRMAVLSNAAKQYWFKIFKDEESEKLAEKKYKWLAEKPEFKEECLLITAVLIRDHWEYTVYQIAKVESDEEWYLGWLTGEGEEYGDLEDLRADKYFIMPLLAISSRNTSACEQKIK